MSQWSGPDRIREVGGIEHGPPDGFLAASRTALPGGPLTTDITKVFPHVDVVGAYFTSISLPSSLTIPSGMSAWYTLLKQRVGGGNGGVAFGYVGYSSVVGPTNSAGVGGTALWGASNATKAAIVVSKNLSLDDGWSAQPCYVAGVETAAPGLVTVAGAPPYLGVEFFAPGVMGTDNTRISTRDYWLPTTNRFVDGDELAVSVVFNASQISTAIASEISTLTGFADIRVRTMKLNQTREW